jgi:predicted DNA-binding transcriptional regulator YafY
MRADRLLTMLLLLHTRGRTTAQDLARKLEVSERTIYRDLDALTIAGVPVYALSGPGGGIFLDEQYRVTLTGLSATEMLALFAPNERGPLQDLGIGQAAPLLKLLAALPVAQRSEVERMRQRLYVDPANWFQLVEPLPMLATLQQAVWEDRRVAVVYQPVEGAARERRLDAYGLVAKANIWYLIAKPPETPAAPLRTYRVARLQQVTLLEERFSRDPSFDLEDYWRAACIQFEHDARKHEPPCPATLRVHPDMLWYFPSYLEGIYTRLGEADAAGWHTLQVEFSSFGEARMRVLDLGSYVEVFAPVALRQAVLDTAQAILHRTDGRLSAGNQAAPRETARRNPLADRPSEV